MFDAAPCNTDFKRVTRRPIIHDLGIAGEPETALLERVRSDVGIALGAVIPEEHAFVHPARNIQRNLAVALAGRRRLKFGNTLFKIRAAIAAQIRRCGRCKASKRPARKPPLTPTRLLDNLNTDFIGAPLFY